MISDVKAVIFDLDGTLVDSMWMWKQIDVEYLARHGLELPDDLQSCIEGMSFSETAEYFKKRFGLEDSIEKIKADWNAMAWDKYANQVPLKAGVADFLEELRNKNIKMGIATSNSRELVDLVTKKNQIHSYFESIRTSCEVNKGKPSPDIYLLVAEDLGVAPGDFLVYEEVVQGIMAGKNANMTVCAVKDAYSENQDDEKRALSDYYINSYVELLNPPLMKETLAERKAW